MIGFGEAIRNGFQQALNVRGRASRAEYWWWALLSAGVLLVLPTAGDSLLLLPVTLFLLVSNLTVSVRRLHDRGLSGLWLLVGLTAIGSLGLLVVFLLPGDAASNRFGPPRLPDGAATGWAPPGGGTWRGRWDGGDPGPQGGAGPGADPGGIGERGWDDLPPPPPPGPAGR
mgnify:CR=1 FL=1